MPSGAQHATGGYAGAFNCVSTLSEFSITHRRKKKGQRQGGAGPGHPVKLNSAGLAQSLFSLCAA